MSFSIGSSKTVNGRQLLICKKQPENKELIREIAKRYAGMLRVYKNKYSKDDDFEFSFTLTVGDTMYYHDNIRKLLKALASLENEEKFVIDVKYYGHVNTSIGVFQDPQFYFGEFGFDACGVTHLLCDELKGCVDYRHFHFAEYDNYEFSKFDENGLMYIDNYVEENSCNMEGISSMYTDGVSICCDAEDDMSKDEVQKRNTLIQQIIEKYAKDVDYEDCFEDAMIGFSYLQWFPDSYSEIVNFINEINEIEWIGDLSNLYIAGFWYDLETFSFATLERQDNKIVVKGIRA